MTPRHLTLHEVRNRRGARLSRASVLELGPDLLQGGRLYVELLASLGEFGAKLSELRSPLAELGLHPRHLCQSLRAVGAAALGGASVLELGPELFQGGLPSVELATSLGELGAELREL